MRPLGTFYFMCFLVWVGHIYGELFFGGATSDRTPASQRPKRILIAVNGLDLNTFHAAREKFNLFQSFTEVRSHLLPFPSVEDYSWNLFTGARQVHGAPGRLGSYEAQHFDRDRNRLVTDPREQFRRLGKPEYYFHGAFEHVLNPFVPILENLTPEDLARIELERIKEGIFADSSELSLGMIRFMIGGPRYLRQLDRFFIELQRHYRQSGRPLELILISIPGAENSSSIPVELESTLQKARLMPRVHLKVSDDVIIPRGIAGSMAQVFFQDLAKREIFIKALQKEPWFEHAMLKSSEGPDRVRVNIYDATGSAELSIIRLEDSFEYRYRPVTANPLEIPVTLLDRNFGDTEARELLAQSRFPDSIHRIAESVFQDECDFPDLLITLKDGFTLSRKSEAGSLARSKSVGLVANTGTLGSSARFLRSSEVLSALGISFEEIFSKAPLPREGAILTGKENHSPRRKIELMHRALHYSAYLYDYLDERTLARFLKPLTRDDGGGRLRTMGRLGLKDLSRVAYGLTLAHPSKEDADALGRIQHDLQKYRTEKRRSLFETLRSHTNGLKRSVMKAYTSGFFLRKAYKRPVSDTIPEERRRVSADSPSELFAEVFREQRIQEAIAPEPLPLIYAPELRRSEDVTIVYVPGIYNTVFENEIFEMGLRALTERFGLRVIAPEIFSLCSSEFNAGLIIDFMKRDLKRRMTLGFRPPKYFVLGYSKGGVDTLHAFARDPVFVQRSVIGMLALASPIQGTSILEKTDLPFNLVRLLGTEDPPAICKDQFKASASITREGAVEFLRANAATLAGLTKYYSLAFSQTLRRSHVFMQAAKQIAQFDEPNDGVVTVSSARFPPEIPAVDLGVVEGDHLAGIMASEFPQEAFFKALVITLLELRAHED